MSFKLCCKTYDCKVSLEASRAYNERTGRCLQSDLTEIFFEFATRDDNAPLVNTSMKVSTLIGGVEKAAEIFYAITNGIDYEEFVDACWATGIWPITEGDETNFKDPWPFVLINIASDYINAQQADFLKKKHKALNGAA